MKKELKKSLGSFVIELVVYGVLVVGYFFLVLHFLGNYLHRLFEQDRKTYAFVALLLIIGQGIVLEMLTTFLLNLIRSEREE